MKKSTILWFVLLVAFCTFVIRIGVALSDLPGQFHPNWFTIVPALAAFAALVGITIRKESAVNQAQSPPIGMRHRLDSSRRKTRVPWFLELLVGRK